MALRVVAVRAPLSSQRPRASAARSPRIHGAQMQAAPNHSRGSCFIGAGAGTITKKKAGPAPQASGQVFHRAKPIITDLGLYADVFWISQCLSVPMSFMLFTDTEAAQAHHPGRYRARPRVRPRRVTSGGLPEPRAASMSRTQGEGPLSAPLLTGPDGLCQCDGSVEAASPGDVNAGRSRSSWTQGSTRTCSGYHSARACQQPSSSSTGFHRVKRVIVDPAIYVDVFWIPQRRSFPTAFKLFIGELVPQFLGVHVALSWVMESAAIMAIALANGGGNPSDWQDFASIITLLVIKHPLPPRVCIASSGTGPFPAHIAWDCS